MRKPEVFTHKGKEIVFLDFSNLRNKQGIIQLVHDGAVVIRSKPKNSVYGLKGLILIILKSFLTLSVEI